MKEKLEGLLLEVYFIVEFLYYSDKFDFCFGDFIFYLVYGYYLADSCCIQLVKSGKFFQGGEYGFYLEFLEMYVIFYVKGLVFWQGFIIFLFCNVYVYFLVCEILGLLVLKGIDGQLEVL